LLLAGQLKMKAGEFAGAGQYFEKLIRSNRKYFSGYV